MNIRLKWDFKKKNFYYFICFKLDAKNITKKNILLCKIKIKKNNLYM